MRIKKCWRKTIFSEWTLIAINVKFEFQKQEEGKSFFFFSLRSQTLPELCPSSVVALHNSSDETDEKKHQNFLSFLTHENLLIHFDSLGLPTSTICRTINNTTMGHLRKTNLIKFFIFGKKSRRLFSAIGFSFFFFFSRFSRKKNHSQTSFLSPFFLFSSILLQPK